MFTRQRLSDGGAATLRERNAKWEWLPSAFSDRVHGAIEIGTITISILKVSCIID